MSVSSRGYGITKADLVREAVSPLNEVSVLGSFEVGLCLSERFCSEEVTILASGLWLVQCVSEKWLCLFQMNLPGSSFWNR